MFWSGFEAIQTSQVQKYIFKGCVHTKIKLFHLNIFGTKSASIQNAFKWYEVAKNFISVAVAFQLTLWTDSPSCWDSHCPASRPSCSCKTDRSSIAHCHNTNQTILVFTKMLFHPLTSLIFLKTWSQDCILWTEGTLFFLLAYCSHFYFLKMWSKSKQNSASSHTNFWWKINFRIPFVIPLGIKIIADYRTACITENLQTMPS